MPPSDDVKEQIEAASDEILSNQMGVQVSQKDCKDLIENLALALKDVDERWIDFDAAPRTHSNPTYAFMYQRLYKKLGKPPAPKDAKPAVKKEKTAIISDK